MSQRQKSGTHTPNTLPSFRSSPMAINQMPHHHHHQATKNRSCSVPDSYYSSTIIKSPSQLCSSCAMQSFQSEEESSSGNSQPRAFCACESEMTFSETNKSGTPDTPKKESRTRKRYYFSTSTFLVANQE